MTLSKENDSRGELTSNSDFDEINRLSPEEYAKLPQLTKDKFSRTSAWRAGERQKIHLQGALVGGKTVEEILAMRRAENKRNL